LAQPGERGDAGALQFRRSSIQYDGDVFFRWESEDCTGKENLLGRHRCKLFAAMHRNALAAIEFFC
jgi:hypothetical protein